MRLAFRAREALRFVGGPLPGNVLRGALGTSIDDAALFAPRPANGGPSGLKDPPRPYVFRARHLADCEIAAGELFDFTLHLFTAQTQPFAEAFRRLTRLGGAAVELLRVDQEAKLLSLEPWANAAGRIEVHFLAPTELKRGFGFGGLVETARDRVSNLRAFYGAGELEIDHRGLGARARQVRTISTDLREVEAQRRSSRTGQRHSIGGQMGTVTYEGEGLGEFLPYLEAARWTGVGRQTSWGKGELEWHSID